MEVLGVSTKHTIIFEAELLALLVAFVLWTNYISKSPVVLFIDNNAARDVAISAHGRSKMISGMIEQLLRAEDISACFCWFARVPSPPNPSDGPSRNDCEELINEGVPFVSVDDIVGACLDQLSNFLLGHEGLSLM